MTPKEFFDKVVEMRRCQKEYFKNKRQIDLRRGMYVLQIVFST